MPPKKNPLCARIKRLMQADEDVGKIAQATPVLMVRALDLFVEELMNATTSIATAHSAKTASAGHLRAAIMGNEKFDFLKDIVEAVPDLPQPAAADTVAHGSLDDEIVVGSLDGPIDEEPPKPPPKEPTRAGKRKRKPTPKQEELDEEEDDALPAAAPEVVEELAPEPAQPAPVVATEGTLGGSGEGEPVPPPVLPSVGTLGDSDDDYDDL